MSKPARRYQMMAVIDGKPYWRQEGCRGGYWGNGDHKETYFWQDPVGEFGGSGWNFVIGSRTEVCTLAIQDNIRVVVIDADTREIMLRVKPNWVAWLYLWWRGGRKLLNCFKHPK